MFLDSLTEIQIYRHVLDLSLQLIEALFEVVILVGLGKHDLIKRLLGLDLSRSHQCFNILHRRLSVRVLLADHHLHLDERQEVLLGANRKHY